MGIKSRELGRSGRRSPTRADLEEQEHPGTEKIPATDCDGLGDEKRRVERETPNRSEQIVGKGEATG